MTRLFLHRHWLVALGLTLLPLSGNAQEEESVIGEGTTVGFEYTLSLSDGTVVESNVGGDAFSYTQGGGQILPALEAALTGLAVNDTKQVTLEPGDAYGDVNPEAFQEIPIAQIPEEARVVDTILGAEGYEGPIRVHEIREDIVILDFNNPLAGKTLTFDIKIVSLE